MRVLDIIPGTTVDGPGLRTAIYFAGCDHRCPGCHNPQSWDPEGGRDMSVQEILAEVEENGFDVTFTGGDPFFQAEALSELAGAIHGIGKRIWCYTGYIFETMAADDSFNKVLGYIDVLVDGPFVETLKDKDLLFKGSSNQRLIDVAASRAAGETVLWDGEAFTKVL